MQLGRVVLKTPEGNPIIITVIKGVLKENNRNTGQKGKAYLFIFLRDKNRPSFSSFAFLFFFCLPSLMAPSAVLFAVLLQLYLTFIIFYYCLLIALRLKNTLVGAKLE
jgi:hypothetical protein